MAMWACIPVKTESVRLRPLHLQRERRRGRPGRSRHPAGAEPGLRSPPSRWRRFPCPAAPAGHLHGPDRRARPGCRRRVRSLGFALRRPRDKHKTHPLHRHPSRRACRVLPPGPSEQAEALDSAVLRRRDRGDCVERPLQDLQRRPERLPADHRSRRAARRRLSRRLARHPRLPFGYGVIHDVPSAEGEDGWAPRRRSDQGRRTAAGSGRGQGFQGEGVAAHAFPSHLDRRQAGPASHHSIRAGFVAL